MDNLSIILGSERLVELESELHGRHKIYKLREALVSLSKEFDHTYIDTAADRCLIPIDCDDFSRQGLYSLQQKIAEIKEGYPVLSEYISQSVKMRESHQAKNPLITLALKHKLSRSLVAIFSLLDHEKALS
jgi:chromosome partitioning protein